MNCIEYLYHEKNCTIFESGIFYSFLSLDVGPTAFAAVLAAVIWVKK